jgi:peptidoglycan-N-acetylglucosamine deacetylase
MWFWLIFLISLGLIAVLILQPRSVFRVVSMLIPGVTYFFETQEKVIALSIDDGVDPNTTPKLLEVLAKHQVHATFFLISSRVESSIVTELIQQGHEIGNHQTQDELVVKLSPQAFEARVVEADRVLSAFAPLRWLRPGGGWYKKSMLDTAHKYGYQVVLGDIFPYDTFIASAWFSTQYILWKVRPGSIVILHDTGKWGERTAETLEKILPELKRRDYRVTTVSELSSLQG